MSTLACSVNVMLFDADVNGFDWPMLLVVKSGTTTNIGFAPPSTPSNVSFRTVIAEDTIGDVYAPDFTDDETLTDGEACPEAPFWSSNHNVYVELLSIDAPPTVTSKDPALLFHDPVL